MKVAINGFGRIGRNFFKIALARSDMDIVAINDLTDAPTLAYLLKYDSTYGVYDREVSAEGDELIVDGKRYKIMAEKDPAALPWGELGVDVVVECTGLFTKTEDAKKHIEAGAKKIVISAPAKDEGARTIVLGVNEGELVADDTVVSNASCTTNCITPVMAVIEENFGIEKAM
ncbi:MAG: type I glyceraldehyde-3-phosphate dehydrogenase, partial [Treponema sp.]|nr:type I glyceraldehyde-3-phosphate dehydrogenase [Treponema sp.]